MKTLSHNTTGNGPDMILLHGWGFHSGVWESFLPLLTQHFRVTTIDFPGFGKSALPNHTLSLDFLVESVLRVAPDPAIYLGWSLGGLVALKIAVVYPDRVQKLITISSSPKFLAGDDWPGMSLEVMQKFTESLEKDYQTTLENFMMLQFMGSEVDHSVIRELKKVIRKTTQPDTRALTDGLAILKNTDLRNTLIQIQCPQLYIFGRCDKITPVSVAEKMKSLVYNAQICVMQKTSHAAFLSQPEQCFTIIQEFLKT